MDDFCCSSYNARESSERKSLATETYLSAVLNTAHDAIIAIDARQHIQLFNTAAQRIFGFAPEDIIDQPIDTLVPTRSRADHRKLVDDYNNTAGTEPKLMGDWRQVRGLRSDGSEFPILASIAKISAKDCEPLMIVTIKDKTDEAEAEKAIKQSIETELKMTEQHLNFAANITHELRTPLNAIIGFSELLIAHPELFKGDDKSMEYVRIIHQAGENLKDKMTQFMTFSEAEAGERDYFKERVNLAKLADSIIKSLAPEARKKGIKLVLKDIVGIPEIICDAGAVRTILFNIISNAIKFNVQGGQVEIQLIACEEDVVASIIDTGIGIPQEQLPYIGRPFFRGQTAYNSKEGGVGLGLALATSIAKGIGAHINIESDWGSGTNVRIKFPKEPTKGHRKALI